MDSFFGIGLFELVMIAVVALLVLGPERLPGAMREVAKWMRQLRNISSEFQSQFSEEFKMLDEINPRRIINDALDPNAQPSAQPKASPGQAAKPPAGQSTSQPASQSASQSAAKPLAARPVTPPAARPAAAKPVDAAFPTGPAVAAIAAAAAAQADAAQTGAGSEPENTILPPAASAAKPEPPADAVGQPAAPAAPAADSQEPEASQ